MCERERGQEHTFCVLFFLKGEGKGLNNMYVCIFNFELQNCKYRGFCLLLSYQKSYRSRCSSQKRSINTKMFKIVTLVWYHPRSLLRQVVTKIHTHTCTIGISLCFHDHLRISQLSRITWLLWLTHSLYLYFLLVMATKTPFHEYLLIRFNWKYFDKRFACFICLCHQSKYHTLKSIIYPA